MGRHSESFDKLRNKLREESVFCVVAPFMGRFSKPLDESSDYKIKTTLVAPFLKEELFMPNNYCIERKQSWDPFSSGASPDR